MVARSVRPLLGGLVSAAESPTTLCPANTTRQPSSCLILAHRRQLRPATIQQWTVLSAGGGQRRLTQ